MEGVGGILAAGAVVAVELRIAAVGEAEAEVEMVMVKGGGARGGRCVP